MCKTVEVVEDGSSEQQSQGHFARLVPREILLPARRKLLLGLRLWYSLPPPQHLSMVLSRYLTVNKYLPQPFNN